MSDSSEYLGVARDTFRRYVDAGMIKPSRGEAAHVRFFSRESLDGLKLAIEGRGVAAAAKYLHIAHNHLAAMILERNIPTVRLLGRMVLTMPTLEALKGQMDEDRRSREAVHGGVSVGG